MKPLSHDALLAKCFTWLWNTYPETRYCCFHVKNENKPERVKAIVKRAFTFFGIFNVDEEKLNSFVKTELKHHIIGMSQDKAIGIVPGVLDLIFYWRGVMYAFDVKIGQDRLSQHQQQFIKAVELNGGKAFVIASEEQFKQIIQEII